ncbi:hypothetical protein DFQ30_004927, partial [Apophysomyces sp. BC1015]
HECGHDLRHKVAERIANRRARAEHRELRIRAIRRFEVLPIDQPNEECAEHATEHLCSRIGWYLRPCELVGDGEPHRHGRIQVCTAVGCRAHHADEYGHRPTYRNHDQAAVVAFRAREDHVGDDTVAEQYQQCGTDEFRN